MKNPPDSGGHAERVPKILSSNMDRYEGGASLEKNITSKTDKTITLKWYQNLIEWNDTLRDVTVNGKIF